MAGDISIHNVPTHLNLPGRTKRDERRERRKPAEPAGHDALDEQADGQPADADTAAPSDAEKKDGHVGTQIDVEA